MKRLFTILFSCFITATLFAQTTHVKGQLVGPSENDPLPYATISVAKKSTPNVAYKKMATSDKGRFSVELSSGDYIFSFQFVGMSSLNKSVVTTSGQKELDLGKVLLHESSHELKEINVVAQKPLVKVEIDKLSYNTKDDPESSTSNVLDMLRKVPLVTVDGEDNIQLKGSSNFKIYLNGKPSNMISNNPSQVLKSMPANSIKNVEVITDPGARYDAEGVGGIINIITDKRVDEGYSGSVGGNGDTFGGYGGNAYLSMKYGKFGFTGNGAYFYHKRPASTSSFVREDNPPYENRLTQDGTTTSNGGGLFYNTQLSYEPDTLNLFNISLGQFGGKFYSDSEQKALSKGVRNYSYLLNNSSMSQRGSLTLSADYQRNFKKKGEFLTFSYRYEENPNNSDFESRYSNVDNYPPYTDGYRLKSINKAGGEEYTGQVDYVNPLTNKHNIEAGLKYIFRDNSSRGDNTYLDAVNGGGVWKENPNRKNDLDHKQYIASGYLGYALKSGKFGLKLGIRGENTEQKIHFMSAKTDTIVHSQFFDLVPSVAFSYQLGMTNTLRWGYNMRISRPGIWFLNPYINDSDPNNISYGNRDLEAEKTHNFNINYGSFSQKINYNLTLSYSLTQNAIASRIFIADYQDRKGVTHNTYANIGKNQSIGLDGFFSWTPVSFIRFNMNGSLSYTDLQSTENANLRNSGFSGRGFGGITFTLPNDFRISANGGVFTRNIELQTTQSAFYFYSFSAMKSLFNKKLDISLTATSPFHTYREFRQTTTGDGFTQKVNTLSPMRSFRVSLTYRFGDLKSSVKKVQRSIVNEDLKSGESNSQGGVPGN